LLLLRNCPFCAYFASFFKMSVFDNMTEENKALVDNVLEEVKETLNKKTELRPHGFMRKGFNQRSGVTFSWKLQDKKCPVCSGKHYSVEIRRSLTTKNLSIFCWKVRKSKSLAMSIEEKRQIFENKLNKLSNARKTPYEKRFIEARHSAFRRGLDFELSFDEWHTLCTERKCVYCGSKASGLDRYYNRKGYVKGNVVPACRTCNRWKSNLSCEEFAYHAFKLAENLEKYVDK
jgi:hypothetical protein